MASEQLGKKYGFNDPPGVDQARAKPSKWPSTDGFEAKDESWFLKVCKAVFSDYVRDRGGIPYSRRHDYNLMRLYGEGNQPVEKYMNILDPPDAQSPADQSSGGATGAREGFMNISWDIVSVAPKFGRVINQKLEKLEMDFSAHAISPTGLKEKEDFKWRLWAESQMRDFFVEMEQRMGIEGGQPEFLPESLEELELFMEERFKLKHEIALESAVEYALYLSNWQEIKRRMIDDFFHIGIACCQDYVDPVDGKVKAKYIDPARAIMRYSREKNFSNIDYWGYVEEMTISELRARTGWDEAKIYEIAKSYNTWADNPDYWPWSDYYMTPEASQLPNTEMPYDSYRVQVLFVEIIAANTEVYKIKSLPDGSKKTFKEKRTYTGKSDDKKKVETHKYQVTYQGYHILNTDYVFEFGKPYCIPRQGKKRAKLSLNAYRYGQKSIISSIIPFLDGFQLAWLKLQNALAMAAPSGLSIEVGALENISVGGKKMSPLDILTIRRKTGDILYKATTHHSQNNMSSHKPIEELSGGIGAQLNEFIATMDMNLRMIRELSGLNEFMDASSPNPDVPVRSGVAAMEAGNNSLGAILSGYFDIKDNCCKKIATRYQVLADRGEIEGYYPSLGKNTVQVFKIGKDVALEDYAFVMKSRPSDEMKMAIRNAAIKASQLGPKQGGITTSDYLFIEDQLVYGNLKYARIYLSYKERQYQKQMEQMQVDNMKMNGENMAQQEQMKAQAEQEKVKIETQKDIAVLNQKSENAIKEEMVRHENKMREIALQNSGSTQKEAVRGLSTIEAKKVQPTQTKDGRSKD